MKPNIALLDPVGIEDPVEMVALMLDDARVKLLRLPQTEGPITPKGKR